MTASYAAMAKENVPCPICGGRDFDVVATHDRLGMGVHTAMCRRCGLVMTNPLPVQSALDAFYRTEYRRLYRKTDTPDPEHLEKFGLTQRAQYTVDYLAAIVGPTVLDVGCGEGSILREINRRFDSVQCTGVEPGEGFSRFARDYAGCAIVPSLADVEGRFDLIIVNHVLEHVREPVAFLAGLPVAEDGRVYVDVPDVTRYRSMLDLHIAHLYHFSPDTLSAVAARAGYVVRSYERHTPPRHPQSIRAILERGAVTMTVPQPDAAIAKRLRRIDRTWPLDALRRVAMNVAQKRKALRLL